MDILSRMMAKCIEPVSENFYDRVISTGLWPSNSVDQTYWVYLLSLRIPKGKRNNPHSLEQLKI